jgi:peptidyl-prolyl cis-trans isomerase C
MAFGVSAVAQSRGDRVVVTIGDTKLTVVDIEARLARVPAFRLRELGPTADEQRRRALDQLVDAELLAMAARAEKLDQREDVAMRLRRVMVGALEAKIRDEALAAAPVSDDAVKAFYEKNRARYAAETRIKIWQIVLKSREDADKVLEAVRADKDWDKDAVGKWEDLARTHSIDKSTSMKKGNLGFVAADGTTQDRQVRVNPALYAAAEKLGEGQFATEAVRDGDVWVIVSRRGTMRTPERSLDMESMTIRNMLAKQGLDERIRAAIEALRKQYVTELHPERLGDVTIEVGGAVGPARRPGALPRLHKAERSGAPEPRDGVLR